MNNRDFIRQAPVSFTCDYNEGAHPEILRRLLETNMLQEPGYGSDRFTQSAIAKIRQATCCPNADVVLLVGGTQDLISLTPSRLCPFRRTTLLGELA